MIRFYFSVAGMGGVSSHPGHSATENPTGHRPETKREGDKFPACYGPLSARQMSAAPPWQVSERISDCGRCLESHLLSFPSRLGGRTDSQIVVERLLSISGEDALTIDRKNLEPTTVKLPTRLMVFSNELPRLGDSSGPWPEG